MKRNKSRVKTEFEVDMHMTAKRLTGVVFLVLCFFGSGCSGKQFGREFENALGGFGRQEVQSIGAPGKGTALVKRVLTGEYAVYSPKYIMHLGDEFTDVRVVKEFSDGNTDYAVIACVRKDDSLKNVLLTIPDNGAKAKIFLLDSVSDKPFSVDVSRLPTLLLQEMDSSQSQRVWYLISPTNIRGPAVVSASAATGRKKSTHTRPTGTNRTAKKQTAATAATVVALPPVINTDATVRLEERPAIVAPAQDQKTQPTNDGTPPSSSTPATAAESNPVPQQKKPTIILKPAQESPTEHSKGTEARNRI